MSTLANPTSIYLHQEMTEAERPNMQNACWFVGIDLAPNNGLETGIVILNRKKEILRLDKVSTNDQIIDITTSFEAPQNVVVVIDVPKSLSIPRKWRQLEIKFFPLRLHRDDSTPPTNRFSPRAKILYNELLQKLPHTFLGFNHLAKPRYNIFIPFKARSPRGCKALQSDIEKKLVLKGMPNNLAPSSVLDGMITAYSGWTVAVGQYNETHRLFYDLEGRQIIEPLAPIYEPPKRPRRRRRRY